MVTEEQFEKAKQFIYRYGRLFDRKRFAFHFENGSRDEALAALTESGVASVSFFAIATPEARTEEGDGAIPAGGMPQVAALVEEAAHQAQVRYLWQPPVMRNPAKSLATQVRVGPRCSGDVAVRVEPDGAVIPCQSYYEPLGYLLRDPWEAIWDHDLARGLRERSYAPEECRECAEFVICGGGCPLYLRHEEGRGGQDGGGCGG